MLAQVKSWTSQNPNRDMKVNSIEIQTQSDTGSGPEVLAGPGGLTSTPLEPPGPVSLYHWYTDPVYRAGTASLRRQLLRESLLEIGFRVNLECKGHRFSRPRIHEQLASQQSTHASPTQDTHDLDNALCFLYDYQKIVIDEANKKLLFYPENLMSWTASKPIWMCGIGSRCVYHLSGERLMGSQLLSWLAGREEEGYKFRYPVAEGKLDDVKQRCEQLNVRVKGEKPKKDDYCAALGKAETLQHLNKEFSNGPSSKV
jgi:hypothetical protein